jgi:exopolyphosphatase / guanosine-5'-triphosphate,3'-diphosphate pyrophosphatase
MTLRRQSGTADRNLTRPARTKRDRSAQGRLGAVHPVAVIDIGSNSVRQVIYEGMTRAPAVLFNEKVLCGLGRGVQATGKLDAASIDRALAALTRFHALGRQADVTETHILATAAARDASNGQEFLDSVKQLFGHEVVLLTGTLEAQYSAWGVRSGFYLPDGIVGDLGGGSLELVPINGEIGGGLTLPLGSLRLAEAAGDSIEAAKLIVKRELAKAKVAWPGSQRNFYAVGGTWRSLAKLHIAHSRYPLSVLHDYTVDAKLFISFCKSVATKPLDNYKGIDAVSRNRRSLLPYGALVMAGVLRALKAEKVVMSSLGVREGYLYSLLGGAEKSKDSLLAAAYDLAILRARSPRHSIELAEWTGKAFATLGIDETEEEARWRIAACYLADIAWRAHPDYRAQQSLSIIANAGFVGISHEGRAYLALANYHRYLGVGTKIEPPDIVKLTGERCRRRARALAALFRVLYLYSASQPGVIPRLKLEAAGEKRFVLTVPDDLADLCGERPLERVSQLAKELGLEIDLKCG